MISPFGPRFTRNIATFFSRGDRRGRNFVGIVALIIVVVNRRYSGIVGRPVDEAIERDGGSDSAVSKSCGRR